MRALWRGVAVPFVALLVLSLASAPTQAATRGYLAFHDVRYDDLLAEGNAQQVRISFQFEQKLYDHADGQLVGKVLEDVKVNVTFPTFATPEHSPPVFTVIDLGDVPNGLYAYTFVLDLPSLPFYCVELAVGDWALQGSRSYCVTSAWEFEAVNCALDVVLVPPPSAGCVEAYVP